MLFTDSQLSYTGLHITVILLISVIILCRLTGVNGFALGLNTNSLAFGFSFDAFTLLYWMNRRRVAALLILVMGPCHAQQVTSINIQLDYVSDP